MVDPANVTNFNRTDSELEEFAIFAILVANNTSKIIAPRLERFLSKNYTGLSPLAYVHWSYDADSLKEEFKDLGIGKYSQKAAGVSDLAKWVTYGNVSLRTGNPTQLEAVNWVGLKTSRFIIQHSRENARVAVIETHTLKGLRRELPECIHVQRSTPTKPTEYQRLENHFLQIADKKGLKPVELDNLWWRRYSGNV